MLNLEAVLIIPDPFDISVEFFKIKNSFIKFFRVFPVCFSKYFYACLLKTIFILHPPYGYMILNMMSFINGFFT